MLGNLTSKFFFDKIEISLETTESYDKDFLYLQKAISHHRGISLKFTPPSGSLKAYYTITLPDNVNSNNSNLGRYTQVMFDLQLAINQLNRNYSSLAPAVTVSQTVMSESSSDSVSFVPLSAISSSSSSANLKPINDTDSSSCHLPTSTGKTAKRMASPSDLAQKAADTNHPTVAAYSQQPVFLSPNGALQPISLAEASTSKKQKISEEIEDPAAKRRFAHSAIEKRKRELHKTLYGKLQQEVCPSHKSKKAPNQGEILTLSVELISALKKENSEKDRIISDNKITITSLQNENSEKDRIIKELKVQLRLQQQAETTGVRLDSMSSSNLDSAPAAAPSAFRPFNSNPPLRQSLLSSSAFFGGRMNSSAESLAPQKVIAFSPHVL